MNALNTSCRTTMAVPTMAVIAFSALISALYVDPTTSASLAMNQSKSGQNDIANSSENDHPRSIMETTHFSHDLLEPDEYPIVLTALLAEDDINIISARFDLLDASTANSSLSGNMMLRAFLLIVNEYELQKVLSHLSTIYSNVEQDSSLYFSTVNIHQEETQRFRSKIHAVDDDQSYLRQVDDFASYDKISGYSCFLSVEGMTDAILDLPSKYPNLITVSNIGSSYEGRPIYAMKITSNKRSSNNNNNSNSSKGKFLVSGGVHPREYAPPQLVYEFAIHLLSNYNIDADITWIVDHTEIHIITHVNPDGRIIAEGVRAAYWRKNVNPGNERDGCSAGEIGVDINRNFDFVWGDTGGASDDPCDESYMGSDAASESETRVLEDYARSIFPAGQQKSDPEDMMDVALGEGISDIYMDVHSYGEYTYYPWGHVDKQSKDNEALEALGRKISSFNGHDLWAPGHDFVYPVSGDTSDYMYGVLGVASYGLEIGDDFYESCNNFESDVLPSNLPALMYAARVAKKPFSLGKGPDVLDLSAVMVDDYYRVTASASDSQLVNIDGYSNFNTGGQTITEVRLYLDVHPDDYDGSSTVWNMEAVDGSFDSSEEKLEVAIFTSSLGISSGRHALFAQARDGDGYLGPVSSVFIEVDQVETLPPTSLPTNKPTMKPTDEPTASPTTNPTETQSYTPSTFPSELVTNPPSPFPTFTITVEPTNSPSASKSKTPSQSSSMEPSSQPTENISSHPSVHLSANPSYSPTSAISSPPSSYPSMGFSFTPSFSPSTFVSKSPSALPSSIVSSSQSLSPSINASDDSISSPLSEIASPALALPLDESEQPLQQGYKNTTSTTGEIQMPNIQETINDAPMLRDSQTFAALLFVPVLLAMRWL